MRIVSRIVTILCVLTLLSACGVRGDLAPVSELRWHPFARFQSEHVVRRGDTLYSISFRYDTDFRTLARLNNLRPPYSLRVGQVLNVRVGSRGGRRVAHPKAYRPQPRVIPQRSIFSPGANVRSASGWLWPVSGRVVTTFVPDQGKKGINIACRKGEKVRAAASGVVAYAGSGLSGYGNLLIIKHNNEYLTAYGNNARNLVVEGQRVSAGQVIAEVGVVDHKYIGVHFEIRRAGRPVNPLNYLQKG